MSDTSLASIQPAVWRILDANFDRAREGLRIIEEWCRFALNDTAMANECKQMRQELGMWHTPQIRSARDTTGDVGTALSHPREEQRTGIEQLLRDRRLIVAVNETISGKLSRSKPTSNTLLAASVA